MSTTIFWPSDWDQLIESRLTGRVPTVNAKAISGKVRFAARATGRRAAGRGGYEVRLTQENHAIIRTRRSSNAV